jgi:hypothetical protein
MKGALKGAVGVAGAEVVTQEEKMKDESRKMKRSVAWSVERLRPPVYVSTFLPVCMFSQCGF